jgi:hypothetical protein
MISRASYPIQVGMISVVISCPLWAQAPATGSTVTVAATAASPSTRPAAPSDPKAHDNSFVIGNDDHLTINVWNEPEISRSVPVRSDGRISLPLAGEVQAASSWITSQSQKSRSSSRRSTARSSTSSGRLQSRDHTLLRLRRLFWTLSRPPAPSGTSRSRKESTSFDRTPVVVSRAFRSTIRT